MKTRFVGAILALVFVMAGTAWASTPMDDEVPNCNSRNWVGTYVANALVGGKNFVVQWQFHNDGTMTVFGTYYLEYFVTQGTRSTGYGVWKCAEDGSVIATWIDSDFYSIGYDVELSNHSRWTYRFKIQDRDSLVRKAVAQRVYLPSDDPTDPAGGFIYRTSTSERTYTRLKVSPADLPVAP